MQSEFELIAALVERLPPAGEGVRVGSGDDAAVTEGHGRATVTTVDAIVEGVHFMLPAFPLRAVGRKALVAALSDLAAMGADPGEAYVVLGVPAGFEAETLTALADGLADVARREGVSVLGGDVTRAPALTLAITCVGYEPEGGRLVTRSGARPGEAVVVTGELGGAAAALRLLDHEGGGDDGLLARQLDPMPRLAAGRKLAAAGASAMIDVSDGVGADAGHLARASGVRVEIDAPSLPIAEGVAEVAGSGDAALAMAVGGGEDYELLATFPPERLEAARSALGDDYALTEIGRVMEGEGVTVLARDGRELEPGGFDHMRGSRPG